MTIRQTAARLVLMVAVVVATLGATASGAGARINDGCSGEAVFSDGTVVDPGAGDQFTVPRAGTVDWVGRLGDGTEETEPRPHTGRIEVQLPPLANSILGLFRDDEEPDVRTWRDEDATATTDEGMSRYDIPSWVPAGASVRVDGVHFDEVQNCEGWVVLTIDGSPWSSPTTWIALGGAALSAAGVIYAARAQPGTYDPVRGRPVIGLIAGGLLGSFLAPLAWALGLIDLDSELWLGLPVLGALLGLTLGVFPPFNRPSEPPLPPDDEPGEPRPPDEAEAIEVPAAPRPAADLGPAGVSRTLGEMEGDADEG